MNRIEGGIILHILSYDTNAGDGGHGFVGARNREVTKRFPPAPGNLPAQGESIIRQRA